MPFLFGRIDSEVVALAIPILVVMGGVLISITAIVMNGRRKDLEHRERLIAMEKGITLPTEAPAPERPKYSSRRANGLVLVGIGLALTISMWVQDGGDDGVWGLIPLFIGVGLLIAGTLDKREYERERQERKNAENRMP